MEDIDIVLAMAESIAAEAAFEVTPCERFEKWYKNAENKMKPKKLVSQKCRIIFPKSANTKALRVFDFDF